MDSKRPSRPVNPAAGNDGASAPHPDLFGNETDVSREGVGGAATRETGSAPPTNGQHLSAPPPSPTAPASEANPFDPTRLRLSQDFASAVGVRKLLTTVPVRKPSKEWWVRVHPDSGYQLATAVLELKEDRETYLVDPSLWSELASEATFSPRLLVTAVNRQGVLFLWPIRLPGPDGKIDDWNRSAMDAAELARTGWVRVSANMSLGAYDVCSAPAHTTAPVWPELAMGELLRIAFRDRMISAWDHPVLQRLRGEA